MSMDIPKGGKRLHSGLIDRSKLLHFQFDGKHYRGYAGDTLASALLANGVRLMGRSFKYHRPRGPLSAGSEEPNAIVELRQGARQEPNTRATTAELFDGLWAQSQNRWPSLSFDAMAVNDLFSPFFAAGFYYKTFMWPAAFWEKLYEPIIRRAAGLGTLAHEPDPDCYDKGFLHCDLLVIGSGPTGLTAALTAARSGADVILAEEDFVFGGQLNERPEAFLDYTSQDWITASLDELRSMPNVRLMSRTTIIGEFDHGIFGGLERVADHLPIPKAGQPRQMLWRIYAKTSILAAGATERPLVFENNDRPGIMLASALRKYTHRWAVHPGQNLAIFTNNSDGHATARDLCRRGLSVTVIDAREGVQSTADYETIDNAEIVGTSGRLGITSLRYRQRGKMERKLKVDTLGMAGGWNPNVHLTCHHRGRPQWNEALCAFVPQPDLGGRLKPTGAASGAMSTDACLRAGVASAKAALKELGFTARAPKLPKAEGAAYEIAPFWHVKGAKRAWVDQQNDVTAKDIKLAHQENFQAVEHLKRYTTLGMATDQGKTSNIAGLAIMAEVAGKPIQEVGTTMFRPPYTPTAIGAFAGRSRDRDFRPIRKTPSHFWAEEQGAVFVEVGMWLRAQWYPKNGETHWRQSVDREVTQTRKNVGVCDVTTLGKIDVQGRDAAAFLNKLYCNGFAKLAVGKARYGLMLREDGIAMDDGTAARLGEDHFVVTTTTANAVGVYRHMEFVRQCLFPDMDVQLISTTDAWAQFSIAGPHARDLLRKVVDAEFDLSNDAFPFMACAPITVCGGLRARLFRISFSGELAFELAVPTAYGDAMIRALMEAGAEYDVVPYGTEALGVMRIEKGHAAGNELNGTTTALNLGMGRMVSDKKDAIGAVLSRRGGLHEEDALKLVGFRPVNKADKVPAGAHLMTKGSAVDAAHDQGYVTSACYSPDLGHHIAIGFLKRGDTRLGEVVRLVSPLTGVDHDVEVVSAHFIDPEGERLRG